jgi:ATPases involved in chromosome partitioning
MPKQFFDSSLESCVETILKYVVPEILADSAIIRDVNGRLSVVLSCELSEPLRSEITQDLTDALGNYASPYALVADRTDFDSDAILGEAALNPQFFVNDKGIRLLDRRAVGADWLHAPSVEQAGNLPCFVFASIKGGVGRSTALCVAAAHLSRRGLRVLTIDFDLEAPGIGSMLLQEDELPQFGSLDFLVESQVGGFDDDVIKDMIGSSSLGAAGGRVDVIPAIGKSTLDHPENALAKIARAYLEMPSDADATPITIGGKLRKLVHFCAATERYDVILVDSRAGLHETTAAAMLALGGDLLLFGTNQPQTFQGYSLLFAHLAGFAPNSQKTLLDKITFIHAKAGRSDRAKQDAERKFQEIYRIIGTPSRSENAGAMTDLGENDIELVWDESEVEGILEEPFDCQVLHVADDTLYHDFDPLIKGELLDISSYKDTFSEIIAFLDEEVTIATEVE